MSMLPMSSARRVREDLVSAQALARSLAPALSRANPVVGPRTASLFRVLADGPLRGTMADALPLYVVDTDVMLLAMDVMCSTGPLPEWHGLVPRDCVVLWDGDAMGMSSPAVFMGTMPTGEDTDRALAVPVSGVVVRDGGALTHPLAHGGSSAPCFDLGGTGPSFSEAFRLLHEEGRSSFSDVDGRVMACDWASAMVKVAADSMGVEGSDVGLEDAATRPVVSWVEGGQRWWSPVAGEVGPRPYFAVDGHAEETPTGEDIVRIDTGGFRWHVEVDDLSGVVEEYLYHAGIELSLSMGNGVLMPLLACVFALAREPGLVGTDVIPEATHLSRQQRRRVQKAGGDPEALLRRQVTTIHLRAPEPAAPSPSGRREVDWSCRWIVHAHWVNQPCGPNQSLRKRIWVAPYVKGPADKPLKSDLLREVRIVP